MGNSPENTTVIIQIFTHRMTSSFPPPPSHSFCVTRSLLWKEGAREGVEKRVPRQRLEGHRSWELWVKVDCGKIVRNPRPCDVEVYAACSSFSNVLLFSLHFMLNSFLCKAQFQGPNSLINFPRPLRCLVNFLLLNSLSVTPIGCLA